MVSDVLPLRAILFQFLFLMVAIAIESQVLYRNLDLTQKTSVKYAATINLFSVVVGWYAFFLGQHFLPREFRIQMISYIFFEQFLPQVGLEMIVPLVVMLAFVGFMGTFLLKMLSLNLLERLLGVTHESKMTPLANEQVRFRRRQQRLRGVRINSRAYAVLVANTLSFCAILFLLFVRYFTSQAS
jgi:hypothetical protein